MKSKVFKDPSSKSYRSKAWAERKLKELKSENAFYQKYKKGSHGPNHWNTNIRIEKTGSRYVVKWTGNMKIPDVEAYRKAHK